MQKLDECLSLTRDIKELDEQILELKTKALSPKGQIITGMPRGGGSNGNPADYYLDRLGIVEARKKRKLAEREAAWQEVVNTCEKANVKKEYIELLQYRFYHGKQWKQCCALMCEKYPDENYNINKVFRVYRKILRISR